VPAPEPIETVRVVASPSAIETVRWASDTVGIRVAADELLVVGADAPDVADPHAIVEPDRGFAAVSIAAASIDDLQGRASWPLPREPGSSGQGLLHGVPVKVVVRADGSVVVIVARAYAHELEERLA
jgi:hypothetical protein